MIHFQQIFRLSTNLCSTGWRRQIRAGRFVNEPKNEGINQTQLSEQMFRTKGATSAVVQKLKQKGLIIQKEDSQDSRFSQLYPTEKGLEIYRNHLEYDKRYTHWLCRRLGITLEELASTNRVLRMMNQHTLQRYQLRGELDFYEATSSAFQDD